MPLIKFEFEEEFQRKIAACVFRDSAFNRRVLELIKPEYFERDSEAAIVSATSRYFNKYATVPSVTVLVQLINEDVAAKVIRKDLIAEIKKSIIELTREDIADAPFVCDKVAQFARHKAMEGAAMQYVELIERKDYDKAAKVIAEAANVAANEGQNEYNFFGDAELNEREQVRNARLAGIATGVSISTGMRGLDKQLFHKGWGKGEFYVMMGPPKSGKSVSLAYFAKNAAMQGNNVLFVTLEMSKMMTAERIDASITGIAMSELENNIINAKEKIKEAALKAGKLYIEEFPTGTMTPNMLSRTIQKYKGNGIIFDMVVTDYADIMAPNNRADNPIENSKSIYVDLKAMAQIENVVMLTAMQTNRDGIKATTSRMEHAAEDINKIRIPDLVISINATDEEKSRGEARLFFAASRNQSDGFSIFIKQNMEAMAFIEKIIKIE